MDDVGFVVMLQLRMPIALRRHNCIFYGARACVVEASSFTVYLLELVR